MTPITTLKAESLEEVTLQVERPIHFIYLEEYESELCSEIEPGTFKKATCSRPSACCLIYESVGLRRCLRLGCFRLSAFSIITN